MQCSVWMARKARKRERWWKVWESENSPNLKKCGKGTTTNEIWWRLSTRVVAEELNLEKKNRKILTEEENVLRRWFPEFCLRSNSDRFKWLLEMKIGASSTTKKQIKACNGKKRFTKVKKSTNMTVTKTSLSHFLKNLQGCFSIYFF